MQRFSIICAALILIAAAIPFAYYVWPTKYRYYRLQMGASEYPLRINRFTGEAEQLTVVGWLPLKSAPTPTVDALGRPTGSPMPVCVDLFGNPITTMPTPLPKQP